MPVINRTQTHLYSANIVPRHVAPPYVVLNQPFKRVYSEIGAKSTCNITRMDIGYYLPDHASNFDFSSTNFHYNVFSFTAIGYFQRISGICPFHKVA